MAYCPNCGAQVHENAVLCVTCKAQIGTINRNLLGIKISDEGGFLWGLLGFLIPLLGLFMLLLFRQEYPRNAMAAGVGALVSIGIGFSIIMIYITVFFTTLLFAV